MGLVYAQNCIVSIVKAEEGLTKEEIFERNERSYRANLDKHWNLIMNCHFIDYLIYQKDNKFYIRPEVKEDIEKSSDLEKRIKMANKKL